MSMTADEWTVLRTMADGKDPYTDQVRHRSRLPHADFDSAVTLLVERSVITRNSAPLGECLYPTLRGAEIMGKGPPA